MTGVIRLCCVVYDDGETTSVPGQSPFLGIGRDRTVST